MFLRPVKHAAQVGQAKRSYDAVWLAQEVIPPRMLEACTLMSMSSLQARGEMPQRCMCRRVVTLPCHWHACDALLRGSTQNLI